MRDIRWRVSRTVRRFPLSAVAFLACGTALAQVPVTGYVVVQPIDVCQSTGWSGNTTFSCAPFNSLDNNPNPSKATSSTPIGFVDPTTNINITRQIWRGAGIDIVFQPLVSPTGLVSQYNDTSRGGIYRDINDFTCTSTSCSSTNFNSLSSGKVKGVPLSANSTTLNMFFVNSLSGDSTVASPSYGHGHLGANGIAIYAGSKGIFFPTAPITPRFDTLAHEIGHNLNLDHTTCGSGPSSSCPGATLKPVCPGEPYPGGCNVMDAGNFRVIPTDTTTTACNGALYMLPVGTADNMTLGTTGSQPNCTAKSQQDMALSSVFFNLTPNIPASAGGGDVSFTVTYPTKISGKPNGKPGDYIAALVLQLPLGFQFSSTNLFTQTGGTAVAVSHEQLNGNNGGGNSNCLAVINKTPSIQCLEIDFPAPPTPGAFTANTFITFTSDIVFKSNPSQLATMADLGCVTPSLQNCLDLTYVFGSLHGITSFFGRPDNTGNATANSQFPDDTVPSVIVNPADFPTLNPNQTFVGDNQTGCTSTSTSPSCPSAAKGGVPTTTQTSNGAD